MARQKCSKMPSMTLQNALVTSIYFLWTLVVDAEAITWRIEPRDRVVFQGSTVALTCSLPSLRVPGDIMHWLYTPEGSGRQQQVFLTSNDGLYAGLDPSKVSRYNSRSTTSQFHLTISNSDDTDSGLYACMIYNRLETRRAVSRSARVNVIPRTLPEGSPTCAIMPMHPHPGDRVLFTCSSLANLPVSTLRWSKGNVELPSSISIIQANQRKTATFSKTLSGVDNHVEYVCSESWPVTGSVTSYCRISPFDISINVSITPSSVDIPVANVNEEIVFTCKSKAYPPTVYYRWFFDGYQVSQYPERYSVMDGGTKLKISKVSFDSDRNFQRNPMEIRCKVVNSVGETRTANAHLRIFKGGARRRNEENGNGGRPSDGGYGADTVNYREVQTMRLNRSLTALLVVSSMILCAMIAMIVVCSKHRPSPPPPPLGLKAAGELEDTTNDTLGLSSPVPSVTSSVEYSKPYKAASHKRHSSYTPLLKEQPNDSGDIVVNLVQNEDPSPLSNDDPIGTDSIYENATRFSLPELPVLPPTRFDGRHTTKRAFRKDKISM